ncbi:uncharacterized protein LOC114932489 [Nylanderia fulva]|uniref:uncharacterized protein LOC114932489 n=1 Tax=Nylanderia fulva TaxID=613905 RepID=UPI0010FB8469|nr:uncharacterized protein LOC114932489 [Nylanderia fulva]XP_029160550.1 uncharacterized protein LOC114932489 [Nylanderia fulva]
MATIMSLPNEVIILILMKLPIKDIENFTATCKRFRETAWGNQLWRRKFNHRWPIMEKIYSSMKNEDRGQINFKKQIKINLKFLKEIWELISRIYMDETSNDDKRDLVSKFLRICMYSTNYYLIVNEFLRMFSQPDGISGQDLARRHYGVFIYRILIHQRMRYKYLKLRNGPKEQQFLEQVVTIMVQWFIPQKYISYSRIKETLDNVAKKVLHSFYEDCPTHCIFAVKTVCSLYWKENNINHSYLMYEQILPILGAIEKIIFSEKYFSKLNKLWLTEYSFEHDQHVEAGIQSMLLLTIYHSLMRRFGIYSYIMSERELHIFLKPKVNNNTVKHEYFSLVLEQGQFTLNNMIRTDNRQIYEKHYLLTIRKLCTCLNQQLRTLHEKQLIMLRDMISGKYINISDTILLFNIRTPRKIFLEERSAVLKFVIGTIVSHECIHNGTHIGVIIGWNLYYNPSTLGIKGYNTCSFRPNMICRNLACADSTCSTHKPYYAIFCEHNITCYMEQDKIWKYYSSKWIDHQEIGRFFCRYEGNYYIPNETLAKDYPSDVAIINEMRRNQ